MIETWPLILAAIGVTCLVCSPVFFLSRNTIKEKKIPWKVFGLLALFFSLSLTLRLAFLAGTFLPPYFDSVEHYRITRALVTGMELTTLRERLPSLTPGYYHVGFHLLASLLVSLLRANPADVILILGQVILAALPIPLFFLIQSKTQNYVAAFFGTLLAGFGWYMPGFAVNWGKYPALSGLLAFELVLCIAYSISLGKPKRNQPRLIGLLILGILVSTLFHTRTLVVIAVATGSWLLADRLTGLPKISQYSSSVILVAGILIPGILIWRNPLLKLALDPYIEDGIWTTLVVAMLGPFAWLKTPRGANFCILFISGVFLALFIPTGNLLPGLENQTILDRPFVEMLLYLPFSLLSGLGLAGFLKYSNDTKGVSERVRQYARILVASVFFGFAILMPPGSYDFYPSDCCNFVKYDDTVALDWLDRNTPSNARILTASTQMHVLPSGPSTNLAGTDGGIWIPALTGRHTTNAHFEIDFRSESTFSMLCQQKIDYLYIGNTEQSFDVLLLLTRVDWYKAVLSLPNVQVYQTTGCP